MLLASFLQKLKDSPELLEFADTMATIEKHYEFTPTSFVNGLQQNATEENLGSCKLFAFALLQGFDQQQTLACFGAYYRDDVLLHPDNSDHQNIRQFMINGWSGITFDADALTIK